MKTCRTAGSALVEAIIAHGADRIFCVPGESFLGALDAAVGREDIGIVTTRHESGAGFMALADARLTGRAGIAMVSRGPGAANATIAVHTAQQDALPLVLIVGQVERDSRGRRAFQEVDYARTFSDMAKAVFEVHDPERLAETFCSAWHIACSGLPGAVVLSVPEDVFEARVAGGAPAPFPVGLPIVSTGEIEAVAKRLDVAERPLLIAGPGLNTTDGRAALARLLAAWKLPIAASSRQADIIDNRDPHYVGHLSYAADRAMVERFRRADLVVAVGTRLGDVTSQGYRFPTAPEPEQPLIQVLPEAAAIGAVRRVDVPVVADPASFCDGIAAAGSGGGRWASWRGDLHTAYRSWAAWKPESASDGVPFGAVVAAVDTALGDDPAILVSDAGNFGGWVNRYLRLGGNRRVLGPLSGAMGYGVPAAVAVCLRQPHLPVICFVGDGGFLMTGNELATAMRYAARPIVVLADNASYGTIRLHQERRFPGRAIATGLTNPDFAAIGAAFGCRTVVIDEAARAEPVMREVLAAGGPALVLVPTSLDHIAPGVRLSEL